MVASCFDLAREVVAQKSMSLKYEPSRIRRESLQHPL